MHYLIMTSPCLLSLVILLSTPLLAADGDTVEAAAEEEAEVVVR